MTPEAGKLSTDSMVVYSSPEINSLAVVNMTIWVGAAEQPAAKILPDWLHWMRTQLGKDQYSSSFPGEGQVPIEQHQVADEELN